MGIDLQKLGVWGHVGKAAAGLGGVLLKVAQWASNHPEVVSIVEQVAKAALAAKQESK